MFNKLQQLVDSEQDRTRQHSPYIEGLYARASIPSAFVIPLLLMQYQDLLELAILLILYQIWLPKRERERESDIKLLNNTI